MKHKILILILALFLITPAVTAEEWWNTDWQYRKEVNLSNIENIGRVDDTIIITDIQEKFPLAQEDFGDLRVVESENEIAYELFDNNTKLRFVTTMPANSEKTITIYYGNSQVDTPDYSNCDIWQPCTPLWEYTKLIAWYKFDDGNAIDYSGNYNGEITGADCGIEGIHGNGCIFNGDDFIHTNIYQTSKTINFWVKSGESHTTPLGQSEGGTHELGDWAFRIAASQLRLDYFDPGEINVYGGSNSGQWTMITLVANPDNNLVRIYVNNVLHSGMDYSGNPFGDGNTELTIGKADEGYFSGEIDEVKLYDKLVEAHHTEELIQTIAEEEIFYYTDFQILEEGILFSDDNPLVNTTVTITAFFENLLPEDPNEVLVRFYQGPPENGIIIGEDLVQIRGKSTFFAQTEYIPTEDGQQDIYVWIDPDNLIIENNEDNNIASKILQVRTKPDLRIRNEDIGFSNNNPDGGEEIQIFAMIRNLYNEPAENFTVIFYEVPGFSIIGETIMSIGGLQTEVVMMPWTAWPYGERTIHITVDSGREIDEWDETNNHATKNITVWNPTPGGKIRFSEEGPMDPPL